MMRVNGLRNAQGRPEQRVWPPEGRRRRFEDEDRPFSAALKERLVGRPDLDQPRPVRVQLGSRGLTGDDRHDVASDLHAGLWVGAQVECPRVRPFEAWVDVADDQLVGIADVEERHERVAGRSLYQIDLAPGCMANEPLSQGT